TVHLMNEPLVSVIMPAFNCDRYVEQAIESILNQTYSNFELLVADDASTDNTLSILERFAKGNSRIRLFVNERNQKLLKTRNMLLREACGHLITFQDADDYSHPQRLELMVKEFRVNSRLGLLSSQVAYITESGNVVRTSRKPLDYQTVRGRMYERNVVGGSIMMIRKDALDDVGGGFREYFDGLAFQDYDLSLLVAERFEA